MAARKPKPMKPVIITFVTPDGERLTPDEFFERLKKEIAEERLAAKKGA